MILQLWADVKYHVPTGFWFFAEGKRFLPIEPVTQQTNYLLIYNKNVARRMISPCHFLNNLYQLLKNYLKSCGINMSEY